MDKQFLKDVFEGLGGRPKRLSSQYFYDTIGDSLFKEITKLPEYYLTRAETEILESHGESIATQVHGDDSILEVIEMGSGDGTKTGVLLNALKGEQIIYSPIDISGNVLDLTQQYLQTKTPKIQVDPIQASYADALEMLARRTSRGRRLMLFLGSNIGNLAMCDAQQMIRQIAGILGQGDHLLLGVDIKKDPDIIRSAYSDSQGVTAAFNLNLLNRMNRELGSNFDLDKFKHYATYDPESGEARSYLISLSEQLVSFPENEDVFELSKYEAIHTESSWKYDEAMIEELILGSGLIRIATYTNLKGYFKDILFMKDSHRA